MDQKTTTVDSQVWRSSVATRECEPTGLTHDEALAAAYNSWYFCTGCNGMHELARPMRYLLAKELPVYFTEPSPEELQRWLYRAPGVPFDE